MTAASPNWNPTERQAAMMSSRAFEVLYGGAAGGGKTQGIVLDALRYIGHPSYCAIIFRRTYPDLRGEVIPVSEEWYPLCGATYNGSDHCWTFPSGARIYFGHLQHDKDVKKYQGWQLQYVGWDELTHFTEHQYTYIVNSRIRSAHGIPARSRAGSNPGGEGHEWVKRRWAPWLDPECPRKAKPGEKLRYRNEDGEPVWCDDGALSRVFIPSLLSDNPHLMANDPTYIERLKGLDKVSREQLLNGNWLIQAGAGAYFRRSYFPVLDACPKDVVARVRRWDLAATPPSKESPDPDWTVGCLMARLRNGTFVIEDIVRIREAPAGVERTVKATAAADGHTVTVEVPQDPGQAGKAQSRAYATLLAGYPYISETETGDKEVRAKPFSAQAEAGNVALVKGPWLDKFFAEVESFPTPGIHDDQVDACSGALARLCSEDAAWVATFAAAMRNKR